MKQVILDNTRDITKLTNSSSNILSGPLDPEEIDIIDSDHLTILGDDAQPNYHKFVRALYSCPFSHDESDPVVILPFNKGDIIIVLNIHTNG